MHIPLVDEFNCENPFLVDEIDTLIDKLGECIAAEVLIRVDQRLEGNRAPNKQPDPPKRPEKIIPARIIAEIPRRPEPKKEPPPASKDVFAFPALDRLIAGQRIAAQQTDEQVKDSRKPGPYKRVLPELPKPVAPVHKQPPPVHKQPPPVHKQPPPVHKQPPPVHNQPPPVHKQPPPVHNQPPPVHKQPPKIAEPPSLDDYAEQSTNARMILASLQAARDALHISPQKEVKKVSAASKERRYQMILSANGTSTDYARQIRLKPGQSVNFNS